jgi:hypothetical protein
MCKFAGLALNVGATSRLALLKPANCHPIRDKDGKDALADIPSCPTDKPWRNRRSA